MKKITENITIKINKTNTSLRNFSQRTNDVNDHNHNKKIS